MSSGGETKKRASIVASLTLWYVGLTIVNIGVFWVGAGSNQMRLISEKAVTATRSTAYEVLRRIQPMIDEWSKSKKSIASFNAYQERFQSLLNSGKPKELLTNYRIATASARILYSWPEQHEKDSKIAAAELIDLLKSLQLKELKGDLFIGVPDLGRKEIDLYIPIVTGTDDDLILLSRVPLADIGQEMSALVRLGLGMVLLLLLLQTAMGFLIYKNFVVPIKSVGSAALVLATGTFEQITNKRKKDDEINQLIESFNTMSAELKKNRDMMQLELNIARKIQASILPQTLKAGRMLAHIHYNPLQVVSGDYYDFLELSDGSIAIFIGDASGHGVPAAFITVMAKVYFTSLVEKIEAPADLLAKMNERMASYFSGAGLYLTAFYLRMYPDGRCVYCNALHPDPIILRKDGTTELLKATGFYVGMLKKVFKKYENAEINLVAGDRLVLYTDGLTEAMDVQNTIFSSERFLKLTEDNRSADAPIIIGNVLQEVAAHQGAAKRQDDETLILIEIGEASDAPALKAIASAAPLTHTFATTPRYIAALEKVQRAAEKNMSAEKILKSAERSLKQKLFVPSLAALCFLHQNEPTNALVLFRISVALYGLKQFEDSVRYLDQCLALTPKFAEGQWLRARLAIKANDYAKAIASIAVAVVENPHEAQYRKVLRQLADKAP